MVSANQNGLYVTPPKRAKQKCEVKCKTLQKAEILIIRINLGLSEAAVRSLARAHGMRSQKPHLSVRATMPWPSSPRQGFARLLRA